jgi:hypothetical protein
VRAKALYAASAMVRSHEAGQRLFEASGGVGALVDLLSSEPPTSRVALKARPYAHPD